MERKIVPLILAGGKGSRFWPLSRDNFPKQFLCLDGKESLLQKTMDRAKKIAVNAMPYVVAMNEQYPLVISSLREKEGEEYRFIGEPMGKNTAIAVYYGCRCIKELEGNAIVVVLPADHYVNDHNAFTEDIRSAAALADKKSGIVLLGVKPTWPETGFGYAEVGKKHGHDHGEYYSVRKFTEKPGRDRAKRYLKKKNYFWNSGVFVFDLEMIENTYRRHLTELTDLFDHSVSSDLLYERAEPISFDKGILERESAVYLLEASFVWDDVGSFRGLSSLISPDENGNVCKGNHILKDSVDSVVLTDNRLTVLLGVKDLIVAEDHGVLLVCSKNKSNDIGKISSFLAENDLSYR